MTEREFYLNLWDACEYFEVDVSTKDMHDLLELNKYEYSSLSEWTWIDFTYFAKEAAVEGFWRAVRNADLHYPGEDEEDE